MPKFMQNLEKHKKKGDDSNEKNKTKTEGEMPKTEYQFASVAKRYGSGLLTRISRVRITSGAFRVNPGNRLYSLVW